MPTSQKLALCLSGGGFRAALFHLGLLRRLHELDGLRQVDTISAVSGGSILAGLLCEQTRRLGRDTPADLDDWDRQVAEPLRALVSHDLRTWPILATCAFNWLWPGPRARAMQRRYRDRVSRLALAEIPQRPRFVFCASDLVFGVNWEFTRERIGDYQVGYRKPPPGFPLAYAIAASACFPPLFGPMAVPRSLAGFAGGAYREPDRGRIVRKLFLSDGGVHDNLGLEPALKNHHAVIVSDCGAPIVFRVGTLPLVKHLRYPAVLMHQVAALRKRQLFSYIDARRRTRAEPADRPWPRLQAEPVRLSRGVYVGLASDAAGYGADLGGAWPGYSRPLVKQVLARIRTDLDRFTGPEQKILENHGYALAEVGLRRYLPEVRSPDARPYAPPHPEWLDEDRVRRALRYSGRRLWHPRWWPRYHGS